MLKTVFKLNVKFVDVKTLILFDYLLINYLMTLNIKKGAPLEINTKQLLEQIQCEDTGTSQTRNKVCEFLLKQIRDGIIAFPYHVNFTKSTEELFNNLKNYVPQVKVVSKYHLYSYYPQHKLYLPPSFRGENVIITSNHEDYLNVNVISDHFIEDVRLKAIHFDQQKTYDDQCSPLQIWESDHHIKDVLWECLTHPIITYQVLREALYHNAVECNLFRPTWAKSLIEIVVGKDKPDLSWLDISAGWGDRLLTAMALNINYTGYDPNNKLKRGHDRMIEMFGDKNKHQVHYQPFETSDVGQEIYDIVLTSPPFFDVEIYDAHSPTQSINRYPTFVEWMTRFLFVSLIKAWQALKVGGYLILNVGDSKTVHITEPMLLFIEKELEGSSFEGVIGTDGHSGHPRPTWVWKKLAPFDEKRTLWKPYVQRSMKIMYPELATEIHKIKAGLKAPDYFNMCDILRSVLLRVKEETRHNDKLRQCALRVMADTLMIYCLLDKEGLENTVEWVLDTASER